ncbi:class I SAM-dependent methyltransferase [Mycobacteroides salmoniphilum]|uniref:S-adenosyl-L-methionine-dependent methyltransferase n=1 Tax=Mycobacteroides salmoniphilum TaxID=404941 RepID=A0A4R8SEC0_9MYCO|nr:SAM-dependent methyltransferase [Mycobacteroides salmoniphilum]TDZ93789.1 putative S-adenosyl-L-methionine-dependent methyltransferase [Mycobacteroides salmoniphilum]TEA09572.1 putative S-adenosyl-L-methionine-dependent methyltransferase [Mycobacteroides salmoniphilum]
MSSRRLDRRASFTAQSCAAQRAAETLQPPRLRLLDDPYSRHFIRSPLLRACLIHPLVARGFIGVLKSVFGAAGHFFLVLRVRYTDDVLDAAINDGVDQVVLLGAGFDTTTLRRAAHSSVRIFEVDAPTTQADKRAVMEQLQSPDNNDQIVWVPCDFEHDVLRERLLANGFDPTRPSLFIWLGVTAYLTQDALDATLADLATVCAPGSLLVFDYLDTSVVTGGDSKSVRARLWTEAAARFGEPYLTGLTASDADTLLASHGFQCRKHLTTLELLQRYAPTYASRSPADGRAAITTAQRA